MDSLPELDALRDELVRRIVEHHRHSQWADLMREWTVHHPNEAREWFTVFLRSRSLMINFWELFSRVSGLLDAELVQADSSEPEVTRREYSMEYGARLRIYKTVPRLALESIETLDDYAGAICRLSPAEHLAAAQAALRQFDALPAEALEVRPGNLFRRVRGLLVALHTQLHLKAIPGAAPALAQSGSAARLGRNWVHEHMPEMAIGPAIEN